MNLNEQTFRLKGLVLLVSTYFLKRIEVLHASQQSGCTLWDLPLSQPPPDLPRALSLAVMSAQATNCARRVEERPKPMGKHLNRASDLRAG